ncbi:glutathione hydrolase 7-like [Channa argus]
MSSSETKLNKQSSCSYRSFAASPQLADGFSPPSDFFFHVNKNHEVPLKPLASGSPNLFDLSPPNLEETDMNSSRQDTLTPLYVISITFAIGVTIALILNIYLRESPVFVTGVLVSDHERCTALGQRVLSDHGSSVDAAIAAALCLGVVHPHVSGVGGGGIMMVHDIQKKETRVINFQGTAPKTLTQEMLHNLSEPKAGLQVGVPGMLRGLHRAHRLYGSLSWEDVVSRAAAVAREGFSVSFSLSEAISKVKGEPLSPLFRDLFIPGGQSLHSGSFLRMPGLARVLEAGLSNVYDGNLSQEMVDMVRVNGGVLSREDISNYSVEVEGPVEGLCNDFIIQVPAPPSAATALLLAINILKGFHLNNNTANQTYHWITETMKAALAVGSGLGDPNYNTSVTELLTHMLSTRQADVLRQRIEHTRASLHGWYNSTAHSLQTELHAGQVVVMGSDDLLVSVASSLSRLFGSRLITQSGILLNSLILDFSWPNKATGQQMNQRNGIQPGKRPLTSLMPIIVVPVWDECGIYTALSSSGGLQSLSAITQVLIIALSQDQEKNYTFPPAGLRPQFQPIEVLVDQRRIQDLHEKSHIFHRAKWNSDVQGILRSKDFIKAIAIPPLPDLS